MTVLLQSGALHRLILSSPVCTAQYALNCCLSLCVCVSLFLSVLICHTDAERQMGNILSHTHTHLCSVGLFAVQRSGDRCNEVIVIQVLGLFIRAHLSSSSASVTALHHHHHRGHMSVGSSACSLCLSDQCCGGWYLSWTARRTLSTWTSGAVWASRSQTQTGREKKHEHRASDPFCLNTQEDLSQMHPWTQRHWSVNMSFSHTLAYFHPAKSKHASACKTH